MSTHVPYLFSFFKMARILPIAAISLAAASPPGGGVGQQHQAETRGAVQNHRAPIGDAAAPALPISIAKGQSGGDGQGKSREEEQREERELMAAEKSAEWTKWGAFGSAGAALIGAFAVVLAINSNKTAVKALKAAHASDRAHLFITDLKPHGFFGDYNASMSFKIKNVGNGPAWLRGAVIWRRVIDGHLPEPPIIPRPLLEVNGTMAPNEERPYREGIVLGEDMRAVLDKTKTLYLIGAIHYEDAFGETRETCFAFEYRQGHWDGADAFVAAGGPAYWRST